MIDSGEKWEILALQQEFNWILQHYVPIFLTRLRGITEECARHFPMSVGGISTHLKMDKFTLATAKYNASGVDTIKCVASVLGDNITNADITIKLHKNPNPICTVVDSEWKLQQLQDSANHLQNCIQFIENIQEEPLNSVEEALDMIYRIITALQKGRNVLIIPRKRSIEELISSKNMKCLHPTLPNEVAISFYIQAHKLIFAVYITNPHCQSEVNIESFVTECSVSWLSDILLQYDDALQLCQQLINKILTFSQFKDGNMGSESGSLEFW